LKYRFLTYIKRDFNIWSILTLAIIGFISVPIFTVLLQLFEGPGETWTHIVKNLLADYTLNSVMLIFGCSFLTLIFGVSSAWIVSRYNFVFRKQIEWLLIVPLAIPSYITAYTYAGFFDYGSTFQYVTKSIGFGALRFDIMTLSGLIFILSISTYPYVYLSSRAVFLYQSARLIEASKVLGASERKTFFKIVLPIARPAIVGGLILVIMEVLNDYGAAQYYGVNTFTTGIFRAWFSLEEPSTAIYLSAILLIVVFICIGLERLQRGSKNFVFSLKNGGNLHRLAVSNKKKLILYITVGFPIVFGFILPCLQLVYWCYLTFDSVASKDFFITALQSLGIAFIAALLTTFFALISLYFPKWNRLSVLKKSSRIAVLGYAIPGAIIAIGVMIPLLSVDKWLISVFKIYYNLDIGFVINGTILLLLYAYSIRFLAVAFNPIEAGQLKLKKSLTEVSQLLGKGKLESFLNIELPLLKFSITGAFILVFVDIMKELPLTLILKPYNLNTLAVKAYEYASDELIMEAALPSLCIIATGIIPIILLNRLILR
jgi:iron(III) transport system permease protein